MPSAAENLMPSEFRSLQDSGTFRISEPARFRYLQNSGTFKVLLSAEVAASFRRYCPDQVIRVPAASRQPILSLRSPSVMIPPALSQESRLSCHRLRYSALLTKSTTSSAEHQEPPAPSPPSARFPAPLPDFCRRQGQFPPLSRKDNRSPVRPAARISSVPSRN